MIYFFIVCVTWNHNPVKEDVLIEYVFNPSADGSVIKQQSIKLSCIFIMYFLSFFHFPNQKFISASSLSVWLRPQGGEEGFEVLLSLAGQRKRHPDSMTPPNPTPPPPSRAGGWWEGSASILGADFLFTFSWGHSAGWPCPSVSLQHFNSSFNWNLPQTAQNPPAADPSTFHISNIYICDVRLRCESTRTSRVSLWTLSLLPERTEL